jgi:hypothetical protein
MDPKKILILVVLLIGLVFAGKWTCKEWQRYHPEPGPAYGYGYGGGYGGGYGDAKAGKKGGGNMPAAPADTTTE